MEIKGLDEAIDRIEQLQQDAEELNGLHQVSFSELFTPTFMREYTSFSSIDDLLEAGGFQIESQEDFEAIPEEQLDAHIAKATKFESWQQMCEEAAAEYALKRLGL